MSCDFRGTTRKTEGKRCSRGRAWLLHQQMSILNIVEFMAVRGGWSSLDRFAKEAKKDRASRSFSIQCDQFGRRIFVRTCNNFRMRRILSCIFAVTYIRRVHLHRRINCYCFVNLFLFLFIIYVCFATETRNAGKLQEFVNISKILRFESYESPLLVQTALK